jgi:large subunit ribosomal protein L4
MLKVDYKDWEWNSLGQIDLNPVAFGAELRKDIIARVIRWQRAKSRQGTRNTKTLSHVQGTTKKPWAQKETGRARQGSLRAPHFRGGAVVFGPHPRDFSFSLNKKVRKAGLRSSISYRLNEGNLFVLNDMDIPFDKTSAFASWIKDRDFKSVLFVVKEKNEGLLRLINNIPYCDVLPVCGLNVLDIVRHTSIIVEKDAIESIEERLL